MAIQKINNWADGPFELLTTVPAASKPEHEIFHWAANGMCVVHLAFIRHLNSIYRQAPFVPASEYSHFVDYILCFVKALTLHHHGEETFLFPKLEEYCQLPGFMEVNVEQHRAFEKGFEAFEAWASSLKKEKRQSEFDGNTCNKLIDDFAPALVRHLNDEIYTLANIGNMLPANVKPSDIPLEKMWADEGKEVMGSMSLATDLTAFLMNHDVDFEDGKFKDFPPAPGPVKFILRNITPLWSSQLVKFASCDAQGHPRPLAYGPQM